MSLRSGLEAELGWLRQQPNPNKDRIGQVEKAIADLPGEPAGDGPLETAVPAEQETAVPSKPKRGPKKPKPAAEPGDAS